MKVTIRKYAPDPENPTVMAVVEFEAGRVLISTEHDWLRESMEQRGVVTADGRDVFPEDGVEFMRALLLTYKNAYLMAEAE